ncbi:MAG: uracil-DNA glycosylase [Rhodospirillales bacterium]|nr:uracil-DNA glycosylase [Rhodospirillales bacterium]
MPAVDAVPDAGPTRDCPFCPRLVAFRERQRDAFPDWHNAPVPAFGALEARLLVVGLAPGLRGANRTGRPFTGDYAGDLLYATLLDYGFAIGEYGARPDDGLRLVDCRITNGVRCVPPENKPETSEIAACRPFLAAEIATMPNLRQIVALGGTAHGTVLSALGKVRSRFAFAHGAVHALPDQALTLTDSYHCSRYNTNTGKLTTAMFRSVFAEVRRSLDAGA